MNEFVKINNSLINVNRLLAVKYVPAKKEDSYRSNEHYLAVFDTGQELKLSPEDGLELVGHYKGLSSPSEGMIATTSDRAT
jgi:hypothetical protein